MYFRWSAFVGVTFALFPTTGVIAEMHGTPLSDTIYLNWSGALDQVTLADKSILNEYLAQTFSTNITGGSLQIAFVPRFNCSPIVSVLLSAENAPAINDDFPVTLTLDNVDMEFQAIIDESASSWQYSYNGNRDKQQDLRILMDNSSRLSMNWVPAEENASQNADATDTDTVMFSLLGSRLSVKAVEDLCKAHEPIPY